MPPVGTSALAVISSRPQEAGIFLDFDGTLAGIAPRPEEAQPAPGAAAAVAALGERFRVVAVISGRPPEQLRRLLGAPGVRYEGLYGLTVGGESGAALVLPAVRAAARRVPEAWVEDKGLSLAIHYRQAEDPPSARDLLLPELRRVAVDAGLQVIEGKMVLELVPAGVPRKEGVVARLLQETGARAALYAGDDWADLEAFATLDRFSTQGGEAVKVAVRGEETPGELLEAADVVVAGPAGLVALLRELL